MKIADITRNQPQQLTEMPMVGYNTLGNFDKNSSFRRPADRKILTNPIHVQRAKDAFRSTNHNYNMFFVNSPEAGKFSEVGFVDMGYLEERMPKTLEAINQQGGFRKDAINVIFTNNNGADWRPMTAWIMAHRLGHALIRSKRMFLSKEIPYSHKDLLNETVRVLAEIMEECYGIKLRNYDSASRGQPDLTLLSRDSERAMQALFHAIGTMKSAREGNLRTAFEFIHEALAQFLLQGGVKFNPLPEILKVGRSYYRLKGMHGDHDYYNSQAEYLSEFMDDEFNMILNAATGHILVM